MSKIVFRLNNVPESEADAVRQLLIDHDLDFYETTAGRWGISIAAIWLKDESKFENARQLINEFQIGHHKQMRDEYEMAKENGDIPTFWQLIRSNPILFVSYCGLILVVLALTIFPILGLFN